METKAPTVYCPKEKREVPIWYCTGSYIQKRPRCIEMIEATIIKGKEASVKCRRNK